MRKVFPTYFVRWYSVGAGRFWKRLLSKARRRAYKDPHCRGLRGYETTCNYKNH